MAVVLIFVLVMSGIVLWITSSLIQNELGGPTLPVSTEPLASETAVLPSPSPAPTEALEVSPLPVFVDATWTPAAGSKEYVKFLYYYAKPTRIVLGECIQITWETEYAAKLQLYRNGELILDDAPKNQTIQDCPKQVGYAVYRLVGENSIGQSNWIELQVKVVAAP